MNSLESPSPLIILSDDDGDDDLADHDDNDIQYDSDQTIQNEVILQDEQNHVSSLTFHGLDNPGIESDVSYAELQSLEHNGIKLRANKTVELIDGDFIRITSVVQHRATDHILLRGHIFRRAYRIDNMLPKKKNEVVWVQDHDVTDARAIDRQSIHSVQLHEVVKVRQLFLTNRLYPYGSFRDDHSLRHKNRDYILDHGRLVCRWKIIEYSRHAGAIIAINEDEATSGYEAKGIDLRKDFRGQTMNGGACMRWSLGEQRFDQQERARSASHGPLRPNREVNANTKHQRYTFGDAFCGAGGMSRGAKAAGLRVDWGFDFDPAAIRSYELNFYGARCEAIAAHDFAVVIRDDFKVDILHLSPPCQYFSPIHVHAGRDDEMNQASFLAVEELLKKVKPRVATLEETFGLTRTLENLGWFHAMIMMFTKLGFSVRWKVFRLVEFGLPQPRIRLIVFASCPGEDLPEFPQPTHCDPHEVAAHPSLLPYATVNDVISQIPSGDSLHNLTAATRRNAPAYDGNKPLRNTITCASGAGTVPSGTRNFTLREIACLQGFPLEHRFGNERVRKQIGNAVPPIIAKVFLEAVVKSLKKADGIL